MTVKTFMTSLLLLILYSCTSQVENKEQIENPVTKLPNIVIIYTDDLVNFTYNKTILSCASNANSFVGGIAHGNNLYLIVLFVYLFNLK